MKSLKRIAGLVGISVILVALSMGTTIVSAQSIFEPYDYGQSYQGYQDIQGNNAFLNYLINYYYPYVSRYAPNWVYSALVPNQYSSWSGRTQYGYCVNSGVINPAGC